MATATVSVRVTDVVPMREFVTATAELIRALAGCENLPQPVMDAANKVRLAACELGAHDPGPAPA